jgi:hypothetical protein
MQDTALGADLATITSRVQNVTSAFAGSYSIFVRLRKLACKVCGVVCQRDVESALVALIATLNAITTQFILFHVCETAHGEGENGCPLELHGL